MELFTSPAALRIGGETGRLAENIAVNWLIGIRESNPAIIDMFRDREIRPYRDMLPWSGEFAGKYLTGAYYIYRATGSAELRAYVRRFIEELLTCMADDGYLGCYQKRSRLTGANSPAPDVSGSTWDAWSHYHIMYGLNLWHEETDDPAIFDAVKKMAGLFMNTFFGGNRRLVDIGWPEMNLAPIHIFAILYNKTKDRRYLDFALEIERDLSDEKAGNYINHSKNGLEYWQCPKPRWESMHIILGIAQLYRCTGKQYYLDAAKQIFTSILKTDVHNTGAFSTNEQATGDPFAEGPIETCCVVAYNALALEILKLTGDPAIADFLELSLYNAVMGSFSPSGRWSTYNTPMEGVRCANYHSIVFQSRPGSPDLNCCSVNAPRGVGMVSDWAVMSDGYGVNYINFLERMEAETDDGLSIKIEGDYPAEGIVKVILNSDAVRKVALRIPGWSAPAYVTVDGERYQAAAGTYAYFEKKWTGETITLELGFRVRYLDGGGRYEDKRSIYCGPVLYGFDLSLNPDVQPDNIPAIPASELEAVKPCRVSGGRIVMSLPGIITLSDFYRLGSTGAEYRTWLYVE